MLCRRPAQALGPKCYNCDEYGHIALNCQGNIDPALYDASTLANTALQVGWTERQARNHEALFLTKDGVLVDVYYSTRVLKTVSLSDGSTRQQGYSSLDSFVNLLNKPRGNAGTGFGQIENAQFACTGCGLVQPKASFTANQWTKRKLGTCRCTTCMAEAGPSGGRGDANGARAARPNRGDGQEKERKPRAPRALKCFNCGERGHVSAECPEAAAGPKCYNCGQYGHISQECPSA